MGTFAVVRPRDDQRAKQAAGWCDQLINRLRGNRHGLSGDVDDTTPPTTTNILAVMTSTVDLVCYFGHGDENSWLTSQAATVNATNVRAASGKAVVSVACKTGRNLGPDAVTAGVVAWLGFTVKVPIIAPHRNIDPIGDAIVNGLACLGTAGTMQQARDEIAAACANVVADYDTGRYRNHPAASIGYFAAMALGDHVVLHGMASCQPLP